MPSELSRLLGEQGFEFFRGSVAEGGVQSFRVVNLLDEYGQAGRHVGEGLAPGRAAAGEDIIILHPASLPEDRVNDRGVFGIGQRICQVAKPAARRTSPVTLPRQLVSGPPSRLRAAGCAGSRT